MGECFFWYQPTQVVPDKGPLNGVYVFIFALSNSCCFSQVAKRLLHRSTLVHCNPHLKVIDGITITEDERVKARLFHTESPQQVT